MFVARDFRLREPEVREGVATAAGALAAAAGIVITIARVSASATFVVGFLFLILRRPLTALGFLASGLLTVLSVCFMIVALSSTVVTSIRVLSEPGEFDEWATLLAVSLRAAAASGSA